MFRTTRKMTRSSVRNHFNKKEQQKFQHPASFYGHPLQAHPVACLKEQQKFQDAGTAEEKGDAGMTNTSFRGSRSIGLQASLCRLSTGRSGS
jgi:adenosylmethionine-8-amino-7-oxononanoate aminotransferase